MSNSSLVNYNAADCTANWNAREYPISRITVHHAAGVASMDDFLVLAKASSDTSWNYAIDNTGKIGLFVREDRRAWTSASRDNDHRAVTIMVSNSETEGNWPVSDRALASIINLCADICKRNNIKRLTYTGSLDGSNYTMHKWFTATECPGAYLESKASYIVDAVNRKIDSNYKGGVTSNRVGGSSNSSSSSSSSSDVVSSGSSAVAVPPSTGSATTEGVAVATTGDGSSTITPQTFTYKPPAGTPSYVTDFINRIGKWVVKYARSYHIMVHSAVIAQACVESGYGRDGTLSKYHNFFGMKAGSGWTGKTVTFGGFEEYTQGTYTSIVAKWRAYDSDEEGVKGFFEFLQYSRYHNLRGITDPRTYLETIRADGYATSFSYVTNLMAVINKWDLTQWDGVTSDFLMMGAYGEAMSGLSIITKDFIHSAMDWYILTVDRHSSDINFKKIPDMSYDPERSEGDSKKDKDILGVVIEAGYYFDGRHRVMETYKNPKLDKQVKACQDAGYPWGFYHITRASNEQDARDELYELSFIVRNYPPSLGLWIVPQFPNSSVARNNKIVDVFQHYFEDYWGFKDQIGFYCTDAQLKKLSWDKYQDHWFLWEVKHISDLKELDETLAPEFFMHGEMSEENKHPIGEFLGTVGFGGAMGGVTDANLEGAQGPAKALQAIASIVAIVGSYSISNCPVCKYVGCYDQYCAMTMDYALRHVGMNDIRGMWGCGTLDNYMASHWQHVSATQAQSGDIFIMKKGSVRAHTGMVYARVSGSIVISIEGNNNINLSYKEALSRGVYGGGPWGIGFLKLDLAGFYANGSKRTFNVYRPPW